VITALIADDREAIFTPCLYPLTQVRVLEGPQLSRLGEIVSFRGRFCEQARAGETVKASGTLERIESDLGEVRHRLLLGNFAEDSLSVLGA
jgi:predicted nucleotidyltransferase